MWIFEKGIDRTTAKEIVQRVRGLICAPSAFRKTILKSRFCALVATAACGDIRGGEGDAVSGAACLLLHGGRG